MADYWREEFDALPASIDGVPFRVRASTTTIGRRDATQRFPGTAYVRSADLGPEADTFQIDGYLVGRDYHQARRDLEAVFRQHGPKLLVHPYRGRIPVVIDYESGGLQITEELDRGGFCRISFRCIRHYNDDEPRAVESPRVSALSAVGDVRELAQESFALSMEVAPSQFEQFLGRVELARSVLADSIGMSIAAATRVSSKTIAAVEGLVADVAAVAAAPDKIAGVIATTTGVVMLAPFETAATSFGTFAFFTEGDRIRAMLDIAQRLVRENALVDLVRGGLVPPSAGVIEAPEETQLRHARAITGVMRCEAACSLIEAVLSVIPESREQAAEVIRALDYLLWSTGGNDPDALMTAVAPDLQRALRGARAAAVKFLRETSIALPSISVHVVDADTDAMRLAQRLLGDASRWEAIAHRNRVASPDFIPRGTRVEYIAA